MEKFGICLEEREMVVVTTIIGQTLPVFRGQGPRTLDNAYGVNLQRKELPHIPDNFRISYQTLM